MEKNRVLNHSPSLFDSPGTEAFASEQALQYLDKVEYVCTL